MSRELKFFQAINEALDLCMASDPNVYVMGLGAPDTKGIFETTLGLQEKYGPRRVLDMPTSENGMTGIAIGSALVGMRPVIVHQRTEFALLAIAAASMIRISDAGAAHFSARVYPSCLRNCQALTETITNAIAARASNCG